jgi:polysaccharide biosynthesis transport protein
MRPAETPTTEAVTVHDYLDVISRRKWFILFIAVVSVAIGLLLSLRQSAAYRSTAHAIVPQSSTLQGSSAAQLQRSPEAEAALARQPAIAAAVIRETDADLSTEEFLANSRVSADPEADLLEFSVTAESPELAVQLVNEYTNQFDGYRGDVANRLFEPALARLEDEIAEVETDVEAAAAGGEGLSATQALQTQRYQELIDEQLRLFSAEALLARSLVTVPAERAVKTGGSGLQSILLALGFGLVLGTILAFVREALDPHVRSADEAGERLGLPLLARVPRPPRHVGLRSQMVMLEDPNSSNAEAFRVLRTNLEFANASFGARTVLVAGATEGDGRSTTLANLGVALARSGRSVILADLNLRRPHLGAFFGFDGVAGVTEVALKRVDLDDALVRLSGLENGAAWDQIDGDLSLLPAGSLPTDPGDLVGTKGVANILRDLADRSEFVLVDSPPLLSFADGVALSSRVDAMIVVVRLDIRRPEIEELRRMLDVCPASKLGYVVTEGGWETPEARASRALVPEPAREQPAWAEAPER